MSENPIINSPTEGEFSTLSTGPPITPSLNENFNDESLKNIEKNQQKDDSINESLQIRRESNVNGDETNASISISNARRHLKDSNDQLIRDSTLPEDNEKIRNNSPPQRRKLGNSIPTNSTSNESPINFKANEENSNNIKSIPDIADDNSASVKCINQMKKSSAIIVIEDESNNDGSQLGIVGPPITAGDVLNADELVDPPKDDNADYHVVEWIEQSSLRNTQTQTIRNTQKDAVQHQQQSTRKSQKIVTSIIKRSIKW